MSNIIKQEKALKAKLRELQKQVASTEQSIENLADVKSGDKPSEDQARLIKSQSYSYVVHFGRRKALRKVGSPGLICVSPRRFSSVKEAYQHGKRFTKIQKHKNFNVVQVSKKANAWINWTTGKTNPVTT